MALAILEDEAKEELEHIHYSTYADNDISLYKHMQKQGYYWPDMAKDSANIQKKLPKMPRVDRRQRVLIHTESERLEAAVPRLPSTPTTATKSMPQKSKRSSQGSLWTEVCCSGRGFN